MIGGEISKDLHPPRVLHLASWAIAVAMAGVFSVTVGLTVSSKLNQISAETADSTSSESTGKVTKPFYTSDGKETGESIVETCKEGALVAINNYPPSSDILKQLPVEDGVGINKTWLNKMGQLSWRCSHVCVKGFNTGDWRSADNKGNVKTALTGAKYTSDGQEQTLQVLTSEQIIELMKNGDATQMKSVVNIDSLKSRCEGPNSVDYASAGTKLNDLVILKRESTNTVATLSGGTDPANPAIGDAANPGSSSGGTSSASSNDSDYAGENGPSSGSAPSTTVPTSVPGYTTQNTSSVAQCWTSVANESANHLKKHLGSYNQTQATQIIKDISGELQVSSLHGSGSAFGKQILQSYNQYANMAKDQKKLKNNESALLASCDKVLQRIPNLSTARSDIETLAKEKQKLLDTFDKISPQDTTKGLNLTSQIKIENYTSAFAYSGDIKNIKAFFNHISKKNFTVSLEKQRYQDLTGLKYLKYDLNATRDLQKQLNEILAQNPQATGAKSTIVVKGNIAISNKNINGNSVDNGKNSTIHICVYLLSDKNNCQKIKTQRRDGAFEISFNNILSDQIKDFTNSYDVDKIMVYAVADPGANLLEKWTNNMRNVYKAYPSQKTQKIPESLGVTFTNSGNSKYILQIHKPIILYGQSIRLRKSLDWEDVPSPQYDVEGVNMVKKNRDQFMKDTGKGNCLLLPSNTMAD